MVQISSAKPGEESEEILEGEVRGVGVHEPADRKEPGPAAQARGAVPEPDAEGCGCGLTGATLSLGKFVERYAVLRPLVQARRRAFWVFLAGEQTAASVESAAFLRTAHKPDLQGFRAG